MLKRKIFCTALCLFACLSCFAQPWETDARYIKHWNSQPDCRVHFFNKHFVGVLLDGNTLLERDVYLPQWLASFLPITINMRFDLFPDTTIIDEFEQLLIKNLNANDNFLMSDPPYLDESYYLRQYVFVRDSNKRYLLASFQIDEENTEIINGRYCWKKQTDSLHQKTYRYFLLVYTKRFIGIPFDIWTRYNNPFYVLYDIDAKIMDFFFVGEKGKN